MSAAKQKSLAIGADHAGCALKDEVKTYINSLGWKVVDVGTFNNERVQRKSSTCDMASFLVVFLSLCSVIILISLKLCVTMLSLDKLVCRYLCPCLASLEPRCHCFFFLDRGVLICGTGIGMGIAANKVPGIRAGVVFEHYGATMARAHNDANVICFGQRTTGCSRFETLSSHSSFHVTFAGVEIAKEILQAFLTTDFLDGPDSNHPRRVNKIKAMESGVPHPGL